MMMPDIDGSLKSASWASDFLRHLAREEVDQALQIANKALDAARDAGTKANAFLALARAQLLGRELLKAVEAAEQGVEAAKKADALTQATAHQIAAKAYLATFQVPEATAAADAAVEVAQGKAEAAALTTRAQVCLARDKKQEALKVARQAVSLFKEGKDQQGEAAAGEVVVRGCLAAKKGSEALRAANEVLAIYQGSGSEGESSALLLLAKTKQALGESSEAQELAQKAVDIFEKKGDRQMQGVTLKQLADICLAGGHNIDGWQYTREALECFREAGHQRGEASTLCQIAAAHVENGVFEEALRIAEEGVAMCRERSDRPQLGATLNVIATAHVGQLRFARSDQQEQQMNWKARLAGKEALAILQSVRGLEGGDILVADSETVLVGVSQRTNEKGADKLAKFLFEETPVQRVVKVFIPKQRAFMHLDTLFTFLDRATVGPVGPYFWSKPEIYAEVARRANLLNEKMGSDQRQNVEAPRIEVARGVALSRWLPIFEGHQIAQS